MISRSRLAVCACLLSASAIAAFASGASLDPLSPSAVAEARARVAPFTPRSSADGQAREGTSEQSGAAQSRHEDPLERQLERQRQRLAEAERQAAMAVDLFQSLLDRRSRLQESAGYVGIRQADLLDDIQDRRQRMLNLDIERRVAGATTDFLRTRLEEVLARIDRGLREDEVLERMREEEAMLQEQFKAGIVVPAEITRMMDRRFAREEAVAERFGRSLVADLESRLIQAELDQLVVNVRHRTLAEQVGETVVRAGRLSGVEVLEMQIAEAVKQAQEQNDIARDVRRSIAIMERQLKDFKPDEGG